MPSSQLKTVSYERLEPKLRTGDVLLFHGASAVSKAIEKSTHSRFSHAALVIRPHATAPPLIWQAGIGPLLKDQFSHSSHGGAQLLDLRQALTLMASANYGDMPFVRQLKFKRTSAFETVAMEAVADMDGRPFPKLKTAQREYAMGTRGRAETDRTFFCAQLVAETLMRMGVLSFDPPPNAYSPHHFSDQSKSLHIMKGAYDPEMRVTPPQMKKAKK